MRSERQRETAAAAFVALVAFLPFARGVLSGASLYFRDLSLHFFPLRRFALEGLRAGELRFWNPYVHEGVPLTLPPLGYPLDLLALAWPHEPLLSLLLALHVPLGAFGFASATAQRARDALARDDRRRRGRPGQRAHARL